MGCSVTKGLTKRPRLQGLSRRGLHATALEVVKLALGLDPGDPLGLLLYVDYLALRAQQWDFLEVRRRPPRPPSHWRLQRRLLICC